MPASLAAAYYAVLLLATWLLRRGFPAPAVPRPRLPRLIRWGLPAVTAAGALAFVFAGTRSPNNLRVTFLDVTGEAALIQTPLGARVLVNGGENPADLQRALGRLLPPWERRLDLVVVTSPRQDHVGALQDTLARYQTGGLMAGDVAKPTVTYGRLLQSASRLQPAAIQLTGQATLTPLPTGDWRLQAGQTSLLFAEGDATEPADVVLSEKPPATTTTWLQPNVRGSTPATGAISLAQTGPLTLDLPA